MYRVEWFEILDRRRGCVTMGQPLRATSPSDQQAETPTDTNVSQESSRPRQALAPVPSQDARAKSSGSRTYKRRLIGFVHPFQARVLSHVMAYSLVVFVMLAIPVFKPLMQSLDNPALSWQERAVVANDLLSLHTRFWPWALAASVVVLIHCIHSLRLMHRVAGPLYRLKHVFPQIGNGNLCIKVTLREGDYLTPEADLVNQMTAQLQTKINMLKHAQVMLALDTSRFKELAVMKNDPALTALAKQMEQNLAGLKTSLDTFKTYSG
jgi:nitrogen fixation/metabolism regulation signal transduction histidine kinase